MQTWLGIIVIFIMIYLLAKRYETRMVLFGTGMALAIIAGNPMGAFASFTKALQDWRILEPIVSAMGFAMVARVTACDKHLIASLTNALRKAGPFLIPGAVFITAAINSSLTSAAGVAAAVGSILIPLLMAAGVHPAAAASAVMAGTFGSNYNPGHVHAVLVADLAHKTPMDVLAVQSLPLTFALIIGAVSLTAITFYLKEDKGYVLAASKATSDLDGLKINYLYAVIPLLPLFILVLGNTVIPVLKMPVSHAMLIGVLAALVVTRSNPAKISEAFFKGFGDSFGHIFGIIVTAFMFVDGMTALGLIQALIDAMTSSPAVAKLAAALGPWSLAVISGSGEAASIAFNKAVSAHAAQFGLDTIHMGAMATLSGAIGRTMSAISGATIICAGFAGINPLEIAKRNALGMIIALIVTYLTLM
jgi:C4-dicarboxylate transporter, DcuC family